MSGIYSADYSEFISPLVAIDSTGLKATFQPAQSVEVYTLGFICGVVMTGTALVTINVEDDITGGNSTSPAILAVPNLAAGKGAYAHIGDPNSVIHVEKIRVDAGQKLEFVVAVAASVGDGYYFVLHKPVGVTIADGRDRLVDRASFR